MAIYHYKDSPLIDSVEIMTPHPGVAQATITTTNSATPEQLEDLRKRLGTCKFSTMMDTVNDRAVIQVRGLKNAKSLLSSLNTLGLAGNSVEKETTANDDKKVSYRDKVRGKALFLSAIFYDLGNAAFIISGIQRGRHNADGKFTSNDISEILIGGAFGVGDVLMTAFGESRGDEELSAAAVGLKRHLHRKGIQIPEGNDLNPDTLHQNGVLKATHRWMHSHITQVKCMSEVFGGLFTIHSAMKPGNRNNGKLVAGLLLSTGWMATLLLDKPRGHSIFDGEQPETPTMAQVVANNPRGLIARPAAMLNNVSNLWGSLNPNNGERTRFRNDVLEAQNKLRQNNNASNMTQLSRAQIRQHDYMWNVISACSFMVANGLFGLSGSKRPVDTEDDKRVMHDLILLSANVLAKQPEKVREATIDETADYVSKLSHVSFDKKQVADAIREKVTDLSRSSWAARIQQDAASATPQMTI